MANPGENVQSSDKRMKDHIEYLTILYSQRPLRQRVKPTQVRPDFYDLRKWGRGNFQNDTGYLYRDKFISEGRYHHVEKQSQIVFQPSYVYATDVNLGCIVFLGCMETTYETQPLTLLVCQLVNVVFPHQNLEYQHLSNHLWSQIVIPLDHLIIR